MSEVPLYKRFLMRDVPLYKPDLFFYDAWLSATATAASQVFFFFTLVTNPRRCRV
jgi:hypothetical protein